MAEGCLIGRDGAWQIATSVPDSKCVWERLSQNAQIFTIGTISDMQIPTSQSQRYEDPPRAEFGRYANEFQKEHKVFFITADSIHYDLGRIAPIDFAFIDGAHDFLHVREDSRKVYEALALGGCMVWHDFNSVTPWVEVRQALEQMPFASEIHVVEGTEVAYLHKSSTAAT